MKRKKMSLSRETLRSLSGGALEAAAGGVVGQLPPLLTFTQVNNTCGGTCLTVINSWSCKQCDTFNQCLPPTFHL